MRRTILLLTLAGILQAFGGPSGAAALPPALTGVGIVEHLGAKVDPNLSFIDASGRAVKLGDFLNQGKPILLDFAYLHCPMLCPLVWDGIAKGLRTNPWTPGKEYTILTVDLDWHDDPAQAKPVQDRLMKSLDKPGTNQGWHILIGDRNTVKTLATTAGFNYRYIPGKDQFAHGAGIIFLSPGGKVSRYLYGVDFSPRDMRLALLDASQDKELSLSDKVILFCYHYDSNAKGYVLFAQHVMTAGGGIVLVLLALLLGPLWWREVYRKKQATKTAAKLGESV